MNLNFIQDSDKVHVQTQNQIAYNHEILLKSKVLKQDLKDYSQLNPALKQINPIFSSIVNQLFQHVTNLKKQTTQSKDTQNQPYKQIKKKKKKISIPYGTVKKLQILRRKFIACRMIIQNQNQGYRQVNINAFNQKVSEVRFYKRMLYSYEDQRQYFKGQTFKLEDRVQQIQAEIRKIATNQNHKFTDFTTKIIPLQSLAKYDKKISALQRANNQLKTLRKTKDQITKHFQTQLKQGQDLKDQSKLQVKAMPYSKTLVKTFRELVRKLNLVKVEKYRMLQDCMFKIQILGGKANVLNKKLKKAVLQSENQKYFCEVQNRINSQNLNKDSLHANFKKGHNVTRTDYIIYLKQLNSQVKQYFKTKQITFKLKHKGRNYNRSRSFHNK